MTAVDFSGSVIIHVDGLRQKCLVDDGIPTRQAALDNSAPCQPTNTHCKLGRRNRQTCKNLRAAKAHPADGADEVRSQLFDQSHAGRRQAIRQRVVGRHDRFVGRPDGVGVERE